MSELASPYSTGGGGPDFETRVLAYYLGCALTRSIPRGLPDAVATSVSSQALYQRAPLDDILVKALRGDGEAQLALQVKRDLAFGAKDEEFEDVMRRAWETFTADGFHDGVDRFGIVLGLYGKTVDEHYTTVLTWARHAATAADFLTRVSTEQLSNKKQRSFLALIRTLLNRVSGHAVTDDQLWRFCRSFVLLHFDLQAEGSRDAAQLRSMLQLALNIEDATKAHDLELKLFELASVMKPAAGTHSTETLREVLAPAFALRPAQQVVADVKRLRDYGRFILKDIETTAGGVALPRMKYVQRAATALANNRLIGLIGEPGTGKSGVLRLLIERANTQSSTLLLSGDRLTGKDWPTFAQHLGLSANIRDLLSAITTGSEPCVFIDGLDRVSTLDGQRIVNDLLRAIAEVSEMNARPWTIVFTSRTQNLPQVLTWIALPSEQGVEAIEVGALTDAEFETVSVNHESLALLDADERFRPITRNLFMIGRLTDPRIAAQLPAQAVAAELDVASTWWTHVAGSGGAAGVARQTLLIEIANDLLRDVRTNGPFDATTLHSLESDRIVSRDNFGVVRFTHDLFEDWVFARLLGQKGAQLPGFLGDISAPFRLQRAVRLLAAMRLQDGDISGWKHLLVSIEADAALKERWQQMVVSSPLLSARAVLLLKQIEPLLLEGTGERLRAVLTAAVTVDVGPNTFWGTMLRSRSARPDFDALYMHDPAPRWSLWIPLVTWLTQTADTIPGPIRIDAVRVLELWQVHAQEGWLLRSEVAAVALKWLADQTPLGPVSDDLKRRYFTTLRRVVFLSGDVRPAEVTAIVERIAENRRDEAARQLVESGASLSKHIPAAYVDALLKMVIRDRRPSWQHVLDDLDFNDRPFYPASPTQGPFLYLLQHAESEGLRFIHTLANTATDRWRERVQFTPSAIVLQLRAGPQEFFGTGNEYMWFRADGSGPPSVVSGLMALEIWMERQIETGRDPVELFETVLAGSHAIAVPALCLGIALAYPDKCLRAALPIVSVSHFWLLDVTRFTHDSTPSFSGILAGMLPGDDTARRVNADRDDRPQRKTDIRYLAPLYLFGAEDDVRTQFMEAVAAFGNHLPILCEEQRNDPAQIEELRTDVQREIAFGDPANYVEDEFEGRRVLRFMKPQFLVDLDAPDEARYEEMNRRMSLQQWADKTIEKRALAASWTPENAADAAVELGGAASLREPMNVEDDSLELHRGRAVAATAAALAIAAPDWLRAMNRVEWCIETLQAAATSSGSAVDGYGATALIPNDPHIYAVQGFVGLTAAGVRDDRVRDALLRLSIDRRLRVIDAVANALRSLWTNDRALAWELLVLAVRSNLSKPYVGYGQDRDPVHDGELVAVHVAALRGSTPSSLARVSTDDDEFFVYGFLHLAQGLPIDLIWSDEASRGPFVMLAQDLTAWTITLERAARERDQYATHVPDEWNDVLAMWLACIAGIADDETYQRVVRLPIEDATREPLPLVAEFLKAFMWVHFGREDAIPAVLYDRWTDFVRWLLQTEHVRDYRERQHVSRDVEDIVSLMVFMRYGSAMFKPAWKHTADFAPLITEWCEAVAPSERGFLKLLLLFEKFVSHFAPADVVGWLTRFASGTEGPDPARLAGDYGQRTAQTLNSVWATHREAITTSQDLRVQYGALVDALLKAGVALAGVLAERLRDA